MKYGWWIGMRVRVRDEVGPPYAGWAGTVDSLNDSAPEDERVEVTFAELPNPVCFGEEDLLNEPLPLPPDFEVEIPKEKPDGCACHFATEGSRRKWYVEEEFCTLHRDYGPVVFEEEIK